MRTILITLVSLFSLHALADEIVYVPTTGAERNYSKVPHMQYKEQKVVSYEKILSMTQEQQKRIDELEKKLDSRK